MQKYHIDYAIIVDDDQMFPPDYIEKLYAERTPQTFLTWWGRQFHGQTYFNGTPTGAELMRGLKRHVTEFDYGGEELKPVWYCTVDGMSACTIREKVSFNNILERLKWRRTLALNLSASHYNHADQCCAVCTHT